MRTVTAVEAARNLSGLLDAVERGQSVLITRAGQSVATLEPYRLPQSSFKGAALRAALEELEAREAGTGEAEDRTEGPHGQNRSGPAQP